MYNDIHTIHIYPRTQTQHKHSHGPRAHLASHIGKRTSILTGRRRVSAVHAPRDENMVSQ